LLFTFDLVKNFVIKFARMITSFKPGLCLHKLSPRGLKMFLKKHSANLFPLIELVWVHIFIFRHLLRLNSNAQTSGTADG